MAVGDHLRVKRSWYWHHGIDAGDGTVIHASGEPGRMNLDAEVRRSSREEFLRGGTAVIANAPERLSAQEIADRAAAALGDRDYNLLYNNCEHFARWCETGEPSSRQVDVLAVATATLGVAARIAVGLAGRRAGPFLAARLLPVAGPASVALAVAGTALAVHSRMRRNDRDSPR